MTYTKLALVTTHGSRSHKSSGLAYAHSMYWVRS